MSLVPIPVAFSDIGKYANDVCPIALSEPVEEFASAKLLISTSIDPEQRFLPYYSR